MQSQEWTTEARTHAYDDAKWVIDTIFRLVKETGCTQRQAAWAVCLNYNTPVLPLDPWFDGTFTPNPQELSKESRAKLMAELVEAADPEKRFDQHWDNATKREQERASRRADDQTDHQPDS